MNSGIRGPVSGGGGASRPVERGTAGAGDGAGGGAATAGHHLGRDAGRVVDEVSLHVDGLDPSWYRLEPEQLSLFPGAGETATLSVQLPPEAVAGSYPCRVLAASRKGRRRAGRIDLNLDVPATGSLSLILEPNASRTANREARYGRVCRATRGTPSATCVSRRPTRRAPWSSA